MLLADDISQSWLVTDKPVLVYMLADAQKQIAVHKYCANCQCILDRFSLF